MNLRHLVVPAFAAVVALGMSAAPATAQDETQPGDFGNVANADRGQSEPGPHCHFVLPADGKGKFDRILTGASHQAHTETGLPTGVFQATDCPE